MEASGSPDVSGLWGAPGVLVREPNHLTQGAGRQPGSCLVSPHESSRSSLGESASLLPLLVAFLFGGEGVGDQEEGNSSSISACTPPGKSLLSQLPALLGPLVRILHTAREPSPTCGVSASKSMCGLGNTMKAVVSLEMDPNPSRGSPR